MKAIALYKAGGVENLIYQDVEKPNLEKGKVLVKVKATSVNPIDVKIRADENILTAFLGNKRPAFLGYDFSGEIVAKAEETDGFKIGDAVFGFMPTENASAYAEYVAVPANIIAKKPENSSYEDAAVTTIAAVTAWNPLVNEFKVKKGDKVLIIAGSGGVGHFAIQIAKYLGATVIATCSAKNHDFVLSLGADEHIDYTTEKYWESVNDVDFVLDVMGGETLEHCIDMTKDNGSIITTVPAPSERLVEKEKRGISNYGLEVPVTAAKI